MEIELLSKDKNTIQLKIKDADETMLSPLIHQLLQDENVKDASFKVGHPTLDVPLLTVTVKNGKPQAALKKAAKSLASEFSEVRTFIEKKLG